MNGPDLPTPDREVKTPLARIMAYGSGQAAPNSHVTSQLHRLRRGFTYLRAGITQPPIPQFKGLIINTQAGSLFNVANPNSSSNQPPLHAVLPPSFRQSTTPTRVRRPVTNIPNNPVVVTPQ